MLNQFAMSLWFISMRCSYGNPLCNRRLALIHEPYGEFLLKGGDKSDGVDEASSYCSIGSYLRAERNQVLQRVFAGIRARLRARRELHRESAIRLLHPMRHRPRSILVRQ